jgi:predicted nucleotidyltransferase
MASHTRIPIDPAVLEQFCTRWKIARLELFGSMLRGDFRPDSDVDLLVTFAPDAQWGLFDHARMEREVSELLGRKTELVSRHAIEASHNVLRRNAILGSAQPIDVARAVRTFAADPE